MRSLLIVLTILGLAGCSELKGLVGLASVEAERVSVVVEVYVDGKVVKSYECKKDGEKLVDCKQKAN